MTAEIQAYNDRQDASGKAICDRLARTIGLELPKAESRIWHGHPVWFLEGNPVAGYSSLKAGIRLLFWSGAGFDEEKLKPGSGKFKDASFLYTSPEQIDGSELSRWLRKAEEIQWDYKNIVKRKGQLLKLK